jgi:hypothetical protein
MTQVTMPTWAPWFFMAEGALVVLTFDGMLDYSWGHGAHNLAALTFMIGVLWWSRYRRQSK